MKLLDVVLEEGIGYTFSSQEREKVYINPLIVLINNNCKGVFYLCFFFNKYELGIFVVVSTESIFLC